MRVHNLGTPATAGRTAAVALLTLAVLIGATSSPAEEVKKPWMPSAPEGFPTDFDWIRLPSDEWLKGEVISMYDDSLEFESDELGKHTFDFGDIKELRSSRIVQVGLVSGPPVIGRLLLEGATARVVSETGEVKLDRSQILSIIVGAPKEISYWSGYANFGGNIRSGNTDQVDYTAKLGAMRRTVRNRMSFDYVGTISRIDSEDVSNNHRASAGWDLFLSKRLFVNVAGAEWYRDEFQNIAGRWTLAAGLGYEIVDTPRTTWNATLGPAWQSTEFISVATGEDNIQDGPAARIGTRFDFDVTKDIELYFGYSALFTEESAGSYNHHVDTGLNLDVIGNLSFNVSWIWDRVQDPRPLEDGTIPRQDDTRIVVALGWEF